MAHAQGVRETAAGEPSDAPRIGVVVVTFNGLAFTRSCIASLLRMSYPNAVVVVVDNASTDGSADVIRREFPAVVVLEQGENGGYTGGNNVGIRWCLDNGCTGVLILNNDTRVEPDFLDVMARHLRTPCIVGPQIRVLDDASRVADGFGWFDWRRGRGKPIDAPPARENGDLPARIASGCCLLVHRAVFDAIGYLDESFFMYYEEVDFQIRAQLAGFPIVVDDEAIVYHRDEAAAGLTPMKVYYNTRNRLHLMRKHARLSPAFVGYMVLTQSGRGCLYALSGRPRLVRSMLRGVRDFASGQLSRADYRW